MFENQQQYFWLENVGNLFSSSSFVPKTNDSFEQQMNAISRFVIPLFIFLFIFYLFLSISLIGSSLFAEPFVIYEYSETSSNNSKSQNSYENEDYSTFYRIKKNDSWSR